MLDADTWAVLTLICMLNETVDTRLTRISFKIAKQGYLEYKWNGYKKDHPGTVSYIYQNTKRITPDTLRRILKKQEYYSTKEWGKSESIYLGTILVHLALEYTDLFTKYKLRHRKGKGYEYYFDLSQDTWEYLQNRDSELEFLRPILPVMVVPPLPWNITDKEGGYLDIKLPPVKTRPNGSRYLRHDSPHLEAINRIQSTRFEINQPILDVMQQVWDEGGNVGGLPPSDNLPLPPKPHNIDTDIEAKKEWKAKACRIYDTNASYASRRKARICTLSVAQQQRDLPFFLPANVDFRGRQYYLPNHLNPQSEESTRALFNFHNRVEMTDDGVRRLELHLANLWGYDKASHADRIRWVQDNQSLIFESAESPLNGSQSWTGADKPWLFLAACMEYAQGVQSGWVSGTNLPVGIDGTCNGLQHYAALGRDAAAAEAVNLCSRSEPEDIYRRVLTLVQQQCNESEDPRAREWLRYLERSTVKRGVMTYPYGVTPYGMVEALVSDGHCDKLVGNHYSNAHYLMNEIWKALPKVIESATVIMAWIQQCAMQIAKDNKPVIWTTPSDFFVVQQYNQSKLRQIQTLLQKVYILKDHYKDPIDPRRSALASGPNVIHSYDSAHMCLTVNGAWDDGIRDFMMNHDEYNTHAPNIPNLGWNARNEFAKMYSIDQLKRLKGDLEYYSEMQLPDPPALGTFDVSEVMNSEYFFD